MAVGADDFARTGVNSVMTGHAAYFFPPRLGRTRSRQF